MLATALSAGTLSGVHDRRPYLEHEDLSRPLNHPAGRRDAVAVAVADARHGHAHRRGHDGQGPRPGRDALGPRLLLIHRGHREVAPGRRHRDGRPGPEGRPARAPPAATRGGGGAKDPSVGRASADDGPTEPTGAAAMAPAVPPPAGSYPIDLPAALRLAESINPLIGEARARIGEALGQQLQARSLLLPTLNAGTSYHGHTGVYQRSSGQILDVSNQSLYFGGGRGRGGAQGYGRDPRGEHPIALDRRDLRAAGARDSRSTRPRFDAAATANDDPPGRGDGLPRPARRHGRAARRGGRRRPRRPRSRGSRPRTPATGEGRQADADRADTEWKLRRADVREAEGQAAVASARLVRRLHLDPSIRIDPAGDPLEIFTLVDPDTPTRTCSRPPLRQRPEIHGASGRGRRRRATAAAGACPAVPADALDGIQRRRVRRRQQPRPAPARPVPRAAPTSTSRLTGRCGTSAWATSRSRSSGKPRSARPTRCEPARSTRSARKSPPPGPTSWRGASRSR